MEGEKRVEVYTDSEVQDLCIIDNERINAFFLKYENIFLSSLFVSI